MSKGMNRDQCLEIVDLSKNQFYYTQTVSYTHLDVYKRQAYVSPYLVAKENTFTKHYFIEDERILSKIGEGKFDNKIQKNSSLSAGAIDYKLRATLLQKSIYDYYNSNQFAPGAPTILSLIHI